MLSDLLKGFSPFRSNKLSFTHERRKIVQEIKLRLEPFELSGVERAESIIRNPRFTDFGIHLPQDSLHLFRDKFLVNTLRDTLLFLIRMIL